MLRIVRGQCGALPLPLMLALTLHVRADIPIVRDAKPAAVIVLSENVTPALRYAAEELVYHVERATGAKLAIQCECDTTPEGSAIFLGDTYTAREAGIKVASLPPETFVLRTLDQKKALIIAGRDTNGDPLDRDTSAGTLFGVYEWLERDLGVRWLWPGELGTLVPKTQTLTAHTVNETISPAFLQRHVRAGLGWESGHPALGFTPAAAKDYAKEQSVFLRRHRMGRSVKFSYGHAFTNWWERFGKDHPEWFQLVNGKRGPAKAGARYSMCVSNPGLHRQIVAEWKAKGGASAAFPAINVVENDILGLCECDACKAWDGPTPPDAMKFYTPESKVYGARFVSDRYAKFWLAVQELARKENPEVRVIGYVYFNYFQAPTSGVKLNDHVLVGFCPSSGWYPRNDDEHAWYQKQWKGWGDTGAKLFFRPNYFLDGYDMPFNFAHQFADDFQHNARNGMIGSDFDALTGHWATQGPSLYLLMRLHTRPESNVEALLAEYYAGFGPAAAQVKAYFDHWENYTMSNRPLLEKAFADRIASRWRNWAKVAHVVFPAECFARGAELLAAAGKAAAGNRDAAARVEFLQLGLTHAKLSSATAAKLTLADPAATPERGNHALVELLKFRRAHERSWIDNLSHNAWVEDLSWKLSNETKQTPDLFP